MKLVIITTVPETLATILRGQPGWLKKHLSVVCVASPGPVLDQVGVCENISVIGVPIRRGISPFRDLVSIFSLCRVLKKIDPDIVHSYTPKAGLVAMLASRIAGVRIRIHTFTGLIFPTSTGFKRTLLISVDRLICAAATHVIPEGKGVAADLRDYRISSKPLKVIGSGNISGVDVTYFQPNQTTPLASKGKFTFGYIGRLNRDKGLRELVAAFSTLNASATLILVGEHDMTAPVDGKTLKKINEHPRILTKGFLHDIRPALGEFDVLVLPSYREGFPNVVLQAGAMAKPVIATDVSGSNEIIKNGFNGWLVPPRDVQALAKRMEDAMRLSPDQLEELGCNARARIVEHYEQEAYRQKLLGFYNDVARQSEN